MSNKKQEMEGRRVRRHAQGMLPLPLRGLIILGLSPLILLAIGGNMIYKAIMRRRGMYSG